MNYVPQAMFDLYRIQNPLLYNLLNVIIISLFSALFAVFSYTIYFYTKKGKFTVITGVFRVHCCRNNNGSIKFKTICH